MIYLFINLIIYLFIYVINHHVPKRDWAAMFCVNFERTVITCSVRPKSMESKSLEYLLNSGGTTGLYNMTLEEKQSLPIIRVFIAAKVFYERIIINKKVKDKKNRRMEQVMTVRSKLTQNMAAQSLLGT